jgi:hypothetical protein
LHLLKNQIHFRLNCKELILTINDTLTVADSSTPKPAGTKTCQLCNQSIPLPVLVCPECKKSLLPPIFCSSCGAENDGNAYKCASCHQVIQRKPIPDDNSAMQILLPIGRSGLAIAAGYAGLFALIIVPAPVALVLGILAWRDIKKHPGKKGKGRALFAIIIGAVFSLLLIFLAVIFSFAALAD